MLIRNQVLHGGAPDVFASTNYAKYCEMYECDAIDDLELLLAKCLRVHIFGSGYEPQPDPYAEIVADAQDQGILPTRVERNTIVREWP